MQELTNTLAHFPMNTQTQSYHYEHIRETKLADLEIDKVIIDILLLQSIILEIVICRSALSLSQRVHVAWPVQGPQSPNRQGGQLANNESRRPTARTSIPIGKLWKPRSAQRQARS